MAISRFDMNRQLYNEGGITTLDDAKRMAPRGESLAYINKDEAALLKSLGGAGEDINGTGIKSYFLKKVFKKAAKAVKKVAKSPIGKAALLAGAAYFAPMAFGKAAGFGSYKGGLGSFFGKGSFNPFMAKGKFSGLGSLLDKAGLITSTGGFTKLGKLASIAGVSGLGGLLAGKEQGEDDVDVSDIDRGEGIDFSDVVRRARLDDPEFRFLPGAGYTSAYAEGGKVKLGRKRLVEIFKDSEIERELGPAKDFTTDELRDILFRMHGDQIYKPYAEGGEVGGRKMMVDRLEVEVMPDESEERAMLDAMMNDIDEVMPEDRKMEFYRLLIPQLRRSGEMSDSEYEGLMGELFGEGKAEGGIIPRLNQLGSNVSSAEQLLQGINQRLQSAESNLGSGGGGTL